MRERARRLRIGFGLIVAGLAEAGIGRIGTGGRTPPSYCKSDGVVNLIHRLPVDLPGGAKGGEGEWIENGAGIGQLRGFEYRTAPSEITRRGLMIRQGAAGLES